ncbi:hypothetical protein SH449x_004650 [Pirellulaceae bacterium SH449]
MHVDRTTMLLPKHPDKAELESLLIQLASPRQVHVRFLSTGTKASGAPTAIEVRTNNLTGAADCELDIYWNGNCKLGDDAVGFRVMQIVQCDVVLRNYDESPPSWILLRSGYKIDHLTVDENLLRSQGCLRYRVE